MSSINDSILLMMVGMLNFLGAILLAHGRLQDKEIPLPPPPAPVGASAGEVVTG